MTIEVTFTFYGSLQRHFSEGAVSITVPSATATIGEALSQLGTQHPSAWDALQRAACAIGDQIVLRQSPVQHGMSIALLPPVAGG